MTEDVNAPDDSGATPRGSRASSAGALLREARQAQGLHIAALAAAIKVTPRKLEALEADRYDELPDITFTRALAQAVCRALKIDAEPVLERLPASVDKTLEPVGGGGLNMPLRHRAVRRDSGERSGLNRPVVWAALLLLVAAVAVFLLPTHWRPLRVGVPAALPSAGGELATPTAPSASSLGGSLPATTPVASTASPATQAPLPGSAASTAAAVPASFPASSNGVASQASLAAAAASAASVPANSADALTAEAAGAASWLSVRDAHGHTLISRTLQPGESVTLDATPPLHVTIGNAESLRMSFRGRAVALPAHETVARLDLK